MSLSPLLRANGRVAELADTIGLKSIAKSVRVQISPLLPKQTERGGIGIHSGLKNHRYEAYGFESRRSDQHGLLV